MTTNPPKNEVPIVDLQRIETTYAELKKMEVRLDPNPIEYGPKRFNTRIAQVRMMLTRLEQLFLQTSEDLHYFQRQISARTSLYDLDKRDLMINDPKCRVGRSQGEREALADVQLRTEIEKIQKLQLAANDLESLMIVIKSKRTDLKDIQSRMRDQMKLIEHDLGMGARWGSNASFSNSAGSVNEIDGILASVDSSLGVVDDEMVFGDSAEDSLGEEEEEGEIEEGSLGSIPHDPAPHAEPEVLLFGDEESEPESEPEMDLTALIPEEHVKEEFLEKDNTDENDANDFLAALNTAGDDDVNVKKEREQEAEQSINDLIASLSDD